MYTRDDVIRMLHELIAAYGGNQHALARAINVTPGYISNVVCGHCPPGPAILAALGLEAVQVTVYRDASEQKAA